LIAKREIAFFIVSAVLAFRWYVVAIWAVARRRKNWVRWLLLIMFVSGLPWFFMDVSRYQTDPVVAAVRAVQATLNGLALCFVFSRDARPWFRKPEEIDPEVFS
jgi:hypothetical protein